MDFKQKTNTYFTERDICEEYAIFIVPWNVINSIAWCIFNKVYLFCKIKSYASKVLVEFLCDDILVIN